MSAAAVLRAARAAGVALAIDGNDLLLDAATVPPASVVVALRRHKAEVVAMLRPGRDGWSAEDWRLFFVKRGANPPVAGGPPRTQAQRPAPPCRLFSGLNPA